MTRILALILFAVAPLVAGADGAREALADQLKTRLDKVQFADKPLEDVLFELAKRTQLNLVIDGSIDRGRRQTPLTLELTDIRLGDALVLILDLVRLHYTVKEGVVFVTTLDAALSWPITTRVYDVRELLVTLEDFPGELTDLRQLQPVTSQPAIEEERGSLRIDDLIELIQSQVAPHTWEYDQPSISAIGGRLVVRQTPAAHEMLVRFLADLQQFATITVRLDAWLVPSDGAGMGTKGQPIPIADWRKRLAVIEGAQHLTATAYNSQRVTLHSGKQVHFTDGGLDGGLRTGTVLDVRPTYSSRVGGVWLELRLGNSALVRDRVLQLYRFRTNVRLPDGHAIAVAGASFDLPGKTLVLAANVRSSSPRATEKPAPDPRLAAIRKKLAKPLGLDLGGIPLTDVMATIAKRTGVNIVIDPNVLATRDDNELKVDLRVEKLEAGSCLKLILDLKQLGYEIRPYALVVADKATIAGQRESRVYDVRDLVSRAPDFAEAFGTRPREVAPEQPMTADALTNAIQENVAPDTWGDDAVVEARYGSLFVRNSPRVLQSVERLLAQLRRISSSTVCVHLTALRDPGSYLEAQGIRDQVVDSAALDAAIAKGLAEEKLAVAGRALLHGFNTQQFGLFVGEQTAGDDQQVHERGLKLDARPVLSVDGKHVTLTIRSEASGADGAQHFATTVHFPTTRTVILGGDRKEGVLLLLRITPLDQND